MTRENKLIDIDTQETQEWLSALENVLATDGAQRAHYLLETLIERASVAGMDLPYSGNTAYVNTIPLSKQTSYPGDTRLEHIIRSYVRWNAMAMVLRAGKNTNVGGHISSFASSATLYEVGQNHFWRGQDGENGGDLIFFQGHSSPGFYARAYLEGRLTDEHLNNFRQEVDGKGLSSYPHPWLMPEFWQFPTVSMGLGPFMAIYQARFMKYLQSRGFLPKNNRKVWAFCGDGEMDEPESRGGLQLAGREKLDNLIFVVNCNLQRLDGPVRGNGKIIQELEKEFRGFGWNVIKVIWGNKWDALLARDEKGLLRQRMMEVLDGDYQTFKSKDGAYIREHFFNTPELKEMVKDFSDKDIWELNRGGHDPAKVYAAYKAAMESDKPTVILAKTIKGYGMGSNAEGQNIAHQLKKMDFAQLKNIRDRYQLPLTDEQVEQHAFIRLEKDSEAEKYLHSRRQELQGYLPKRRAKTSIELNIPNLSAFDGVLQATKEGREISTTMAFVRILSALLKDKDIGRRIVPIVPDESRTFGMEGLFRQYGIWNPLGQQYTPVDSEQLMFYKEAVDGQVLQEGINEAGGISDWIAAGTSYSVHNQPMIPFFIYYSMFGFQRFGDFAWAAGDSRTRGFLIGATSGRTTLNGEGLQHEDGHNHLFAATIPNCVPYDPTFAYELAVIVQDGLRRMYQEQEDVFYYISVMNENYAMPALPANVNEGILKGMYLFDRYEGKEKVQLIGSGSILIEAIEAAKILAEKWQIGSTVWSAPSLTLLARDGMECERYNRLNPKAAAKTAYFAECVNSESGPIVIATDYIRAFGEQVRAYLPADKTMTVLGTDGFGRSDTRAALRRFFEVDRYQIVVAALTELAKNGKIDIKVVEKAIAEYQLDVQSAFPAHR